MLTNLTNLVTSAGAIINLLIPILLALAIVAFFYGLVQALFAGSEKTKEAGKSTVWYALIVIFVMVALYGILTWVAGNFGFGLGGSLPSPTVSGS